MSRTNVFLSDIHIGNSAETHWYQKDIHQPIVKSILSYIIENAEAIEDVIILGDWFEQWNYVPFATIPTLEVLFNRNPELFNRSSDGADFVNLMDAIKGNLRFVNGDHDMTAELSEINRLFGLRTNKKVLPGHGNDCEKSAISNTYYLKGAVWAEHGHQHDLFHKPALGEKNPCSPLPLGYFVSRLFCHLLDKKISSMHRRDAASIMGCSNSEFANLGLHFSQLLNDLISEIRGGKVMDASKLVIDQLMQFNRNFHVEFNLHSEGVGEIDSLKISEFYPGLITLENLSDALFEAEVSYAGLSRFARKHFCENHNCKVAIMGHTHRSNLELMGSGKRKLYVNSGYVCPSMPDMAANEHLATFITVEDHGTGGLEICQKIVANNGNFDILDGPSYVIS